ncbi:HAAS signaling domain-containing protein [Jidongwangia harbinensis]|uniref:HAAS signaling domain-containing protein n=1 Tax=Jidongwangia harbinensis TaxID=2878561 RepID=UPI001CDA0452|nr:hypothetical protein [Jidongwangia harbinensis]MCA2211959.1 hypothetical protein [Jidongwangia harbinensis]
MTAAPHRDTAPVAHGDVVVLDYLAALWAESDELTPELRDELMTTVADYIAMRRTSRSDPLSDPEQIVGRLGPPEALVAAVRRGRMPMHLRLPQPPRHLPAPAPPPAAPSTGDVTAVVLLLAGTFVLPVISPLAGLVIVSSSARWTAAQKAAAWVLTVGGVVAAFFTLVLVAAAVGADGLAIFVAYVSMVGGSLLAGLSLLPGLTGRRTDR